VSPHRQPLIPHRQAVSPHRIQAPINTNRLPAQFLSVSQHLTAPQILQTTTYHNNLQVPTKPAQVKFNDPYSRSPSKITAPVVVPQVN